MDSNKLVIVEDDVKLQKMLGDYFLSQGFNVTLVAEGSQAAEVILAEQPALVMLDLMLPGKDGLSVCREIREHYQGKIMMLTASNDDFDHVAALEIGADDFVTKPIKPRVLLARVRMLLRRPEIKEHKCDEKSRQFGKLSLNCLRRECLLDGETVALTDGEFDLLWLLASHPEEILSRESLTRTLRGIEYDGTDRTIDNRVAILRRKLADISVPPKRILTVRGKGYMFLPDAWN